MQAIILAGGFGTRLKSVVSDVPKPMAPIADRPFLAYLLDELASQGFRKVILAVGYKKERIEEYFQHQYQGMEIVYSVETEPLGTGGCVSKAMSYADDDFVFVLNGDTMFRIDFAEMAKLHHIAIACKKMKSFDRYGEVKIDRGIVRSFSEKKYVEEGYINGGIYYLPKRIFSKYVLPEKFSLEKDFLEKYISKLQISAYLSEDYFIDIGIPEDYERAQSELLKKKALFLDRDGIINEDYGHVHTVEQFRFTDFIWDLCRTYLLRNYEIIVITNQAGIGKGLYSLQDFLKVNRYMLQQFSDRGIPIADVYYCPHDPSEHCHCRKPEPGLFLKAISEHNLLPEDCVVIGDKMTDLQAAHRAGIHKLYFKQGNYPEEPVDFSYRKI